MVLAWQVDLLKQCVAMYSADIFADAIAFASKHMSTIKAKYKPFLLEFIALKFTLDKFSDIIWGFSVKIKTDCQVLRDTLLSKKLSIVYTHWQDGILAHQIIL
jgi:RNase H-like domain found in reverse transcriptase